MYLGVRVWVSRMLAGSECLGCLAFACSCGHVQEVLGEMGRGCGVLWLFRVSGAELDGVWWCVKGCWCLGVLSGAVGCVWVLLGC